MEQKKIFFPNLDGLRFFCFLMVFLYHSFHTEIAAVKASPIYQFVKKDLFGNGNIGVNFFFVLSGFLITYLLIKEIELRGKINVPLFWVRRILRIWPLFYFCVIFGFVIFPLIKQFFGQTPNETASLINYLTFTNNFDIIVRGLPDASVLGVLWSVAIEEQFYLFWPLLLFLLPTRFYPYLFGAIIAGSLVFRAVYDSYAMHEFHSLSCIGDMAIGATGAFGVIYWNWSEKIQKMPRWWIGIIYLLFAALFLFKDELCSEIYTLRIIERLILAIVMLLIILEQNYAAKSFFKMAQFKIISNLGKITYGLYCLHFIAILIVTNLTKKLGIHTNLWEILIVETAAALLLSVLISSISYKFFEKPFLKLKEKFAYFSK